MDVYNNVINFNNITETNICSVSDDNFRSGCIPVSKAFQHSYLMPLYLCNSCFHRYGVVLFSSEFITKKIGRDLFKYFNVTFAVTMSRLTNTAKS